MKDKKSPWLYVVMLNRAPLAIYDNAYRAYAFLLACLQSDRAYGEKYVPTDYKVWRERHYLDFPLQFDREDLTSRFLDLAFVRTHAFSRDNDNDDLPF